MIELHVPLCACQELCILVPFDGRIGVVVGLASRAGVDVPLSWRTAFRMARVQRLQARRDTIHQCFQDHGEKYSTRRCVCLQLKCTITNHPSLHRNSLKHAAACYLPRLAYRVPSTVNHLRTMGTQPAVRNHPFHCIGVVLRVAPVHAGCSLAVFGDAPVMPVLELLFLT